MTKQEQKDEAYKVYLAMIDQTFKAHEAYLAKCKEIDAQEDESKIIDGKRYKLIN